MISILKNHLSKFCFKIIVGIQNMVLLYMLVVVWCSFSHIAVILPRRTMFSDNIR